MNISNELNLIVLSYFTKIKKAAWAYAWAGIHEYGSACAIARACAIIWATILGTLCKKMTVDSDKLAYRLPPPR